MRFDSNSEKEKFKIDIDKQQKERKNSFQANNSLDVSLNIFQEVDIISSEKPKNKEEVIINKRLENLLKNN